MWVILIFIITFNSKFSNQLSPANSKKLPWVFWERLELGGDDLKWGGRGKSNENLPITKMKSNSIHIISWVRMHNGIYWHLSSRALFLAPWHTHYMPVNSSIFLCCREKWNFEAKEKKNACKQTNMERSIIFMPKSCQECSSKREIKKKNCYFSNYEFKKVIVVVFGGASRRCFWPFIIVGDTLKIYNKLRNE